MPAENQDTLGRQFVRFCSIGAINTVIDFSVYFVLTRFLGFNDWYLVAKAVSFLIATLFSFFGNRFWTFKQRTTVAYMELVKFYIVVGTGIILNVSVHYLITGVFHLPDLVSVFVAAITTAVWGFSMIKLLIFRS